MPFTKKTMIRIITRLDSDTFQRPELRPLVGKQVEITVREQAEINPSLNPGDRYPLRGSVLRYDDPFEPVASDDWEAQR